MQLRPSPKLLVAPRLPSWAGAPLPSRPRNVLWALRASGGKVCSTHVSPHLPCSVRSFRLFELPTSADADVVQRIAVDRLNGYPPSGI